MFESESVKINLGVVFKLPYDDKEKLYYFLEQIVELNPKIKIVFKTLSGDKLFVVGSKDFHKIRGKRI
jgi:hypothetical protein